MQAQARTSLPASRGNKEIPGAPRRPNKHGDHGGDLNPERESTLAWRPAYMLRVHARIAEHSLDILKDARTVKQLHRIEKRRVIREEIANS